MIIAFLLLWFYNFGAKELYRIVLYNTPHGDILENDSVSIVVGLPHEVSIRDKDKSDGNTRDWHF